MVARINVIIIGAGLSGLASAIAISRSGHKVIVIDKAAKLQEIGAGINLGSNATKVFDHWGMLSDLEAICVYPTTGVVHSWATGKSLSAAEMYPSFKDEYKTPFLITHRADLQQLLLSKAKQLGVDLRLGCTIVDLDFDAPLLVLDNGEVLNADLIIGADGERSFTRSLLEGAQHRPASGCGIDIYRCTVARSSVIQHHDLTELVDPYSFRMWIGPGAHMIMYPLGTHDRLNIVFLKEIEPGPGSEAFIYSPMQLTTEEMQARFVGWDPRIHKLIELSGPCMRRSMMYASECRSWIHESGKFLLVGDAAHAMFPYLGQGAAQGLEDAAMIGTLLSQLSDASAIPSIVKLYEQLRKPRALEVRHRAEDFRTIYYFPDGPEQRSRDEDMLASPPARNNANFLVDPEFRPWLYSYDAVKEAERAVQALSSNGHYTDLQTQR